MNRRDFLAVGTAAALLPTASPAQDAAMIPVVDTHQHLWDLRKFKLGWLKPGTVYDANFTPTEYAEATKGLNVVKAVYMEVDVVPEQQQAEADYLVELCAGGKTPTVAAVVSGRPNGDGFAKYAGQFKGSKYVKGIRQVLHVESTPPDYCLDPKFVKGIQLLGDLGLSYDLCVRPADLPNYVKLVEQCPGTRFILDHCGNPNAKFTAEQTDAWKKNTAALAAKKNVVCKVSGFLANGWEKGTWKADDIAPIVNHVCDTFGWDRVMFGGDWPVVLAAGSYADWLTALRQVIKDRPAADQKKLLHDNAEAFYGLG
jgi:predicted TIM-barrel fold metal-dependent hydrolase